MIGYVTIGALDHAASRGFYDAALAPLGFKRFAEFEGWTGYGLNDQGEGQTIWVCTPYDGQPARAGNGIMVGLAAASPAVVDAFYAAAMANGGTDEGPAGLREAYGPGWYAAYVRDPCGNKLACVHKA